jgi:ferredoxin
MSFIIIENCNGCSKCVLLCPVEAMTLVSSNDPGKIERKNAKLEQDICMGCGVCLSGCNKNAIELISGKERMTTSVNQVHRVVMMAIEKGKLHNLIYDKQIILGHRAMDAVLDVILKLPPVKQAVESWQFNSDILKD